MRARARILWTHGVVIGCEGNDDGCVRTFEHRSRDFVRDACMEHSSEHAPRFRSRRTIRVMRAKSVVVTFLRDFVKASRSCTHVVPRACHARVRAPVALTRFSKDIKCLSRTPSTALVHQRGCCSFWWIFKEVSPRLLARLRADLRPYLACEIRSERHCVRIGRIGAGLMVRTNSSQELSHQDSS